MEQGLNLALLHRTTRRLRLSEAGERFYEHCQAILAQIDAMAGVMVEERALTRHLRVTAPPSFAMTVFGPNLHHFMQAHPGIVMDLMVTSATPDVVHDRVDVAIQLAEVPDTTLTHLLLAPAPRVLCAVPSYLKRHGTPRVPADLLSHVCLSSRFSELAESWMLRYGDKTHAMALESWLLCDNRDVLRHACLKGSGAGNLCRFRIRSDLRAGRLVPMLPDYLPSPRNTYAVTPHRQLLRPQARAFIDFTRGVLERQGVAFER